MSATMSLATTNGTREGGAGCAAGDPTTDATRRSANRPATPGRAAVLLIFGENRRAEALARELNLDGYKARRAHSPMQLREDSIPDGADLVLLSPGPDPGSVLEILRALRAGELAPHLSAAARVIWLAATGDVAEILRAFDAGADDVVRGPLCYAEVHARVRAVLRRGEVIAEDRGVLQVESLEIDLQAHAASLDGRHLKLRRLEFELLVQLARAPRRVFHKDELLRLVWRHEHYAPTRTVDSHASRLRGKLEACGEGRWVVNVWGVGYRLQP